MDSPKPNGQTERIGQCHYYCMTAWTLLHLMDCAERENRSMSLLLYDCMDSPTPNGQTERKQSMWTDQWSVRDRIGQCHYYSVTAWTLIP